MTTYITLNNKQYPIKFGYGAIYTFEKKTDKSLLGTLAAMADGSLMFSDLIDLTHAALVMGARAEKRTFGEDPLTVAEWLTDAPEDTIFTIMAALTDAMPKVAGDGNATEQSAAAGE